MVEAIPPSNPAGNQEDRRDSDEDVADGEHRAGWRKLFRVKVDNQFARKTLQEMTFDILCETTEVQV